MAFPTLAARFPEMRLAVPSEDLDYRALSIVYGVEAVPVTRHGDVLPRSGLGRLITNRDLLSAPTRPRGVA